MRTTIKDILNSPCGKLNEHLMIKTEGKKKSKYGNVKVEFDGKIFDSKGECSRYIVLRMMQTKGEIKDLQHHFPVYELNAGGTHSMKFEPDFTYTDVKTGEFVVEDFKGKVTALFKKKQKLMKEQYNIEIKITSTF